TQMSRFPLSSRTNAIFEPSGDHTNSVSMAALIVRLVRFVRFASMAQMSWRDMKAMREPFGDHFGERYSSASLVAVRTEVAAPCEGATVQTPAPVDTEAPDSNAISD